MTDIFDNIILCNKCNKKMLPALVTKNGFNLRTMKCDDCGISIVHPDDKREYEEFTRLKQKEFNVKMRMVGNSYAVSIPKEIVDFMQEQENMMNNMVKLCFQEAGKISLDFDSNNSRVVRAEEVKVVKNGKPVYHVRKVSDSADPEKNKMKVFKADKEEE